MNDYYIVVSFLNNPKGYYFSVDNPSLKIGDKVIVETAIGKEVGIIKEDPKPINELNFDKEIKPILRKAIKNDLKLEEENKKLAISAGNIFVQEVSNLKLDMRLISTEYTLDRAKILFTYASEERIDFRDLLKVLAAKLHCRIELKQISSRERASLIGGIGVCGLPLCCTFFTSSEGVSLNRAKNQMLAINIPKLSGQCGKLMCCLKYEDDQYTQIKKEFPQLNSFVTYENEKYKVTGYNIFTKIVKLENEETVEFVPLKQIKFQKNIERKNDSK